MTVGHQLNAATVDDRLSGLATGLRDLMQKIKNLSLTVNGQATGLAVLEAAGYSPADAQTALNMIAYLNTVAGVYFGTASQATNFSFDNALSQLWAGQ